MSSLKQFKSELFKALAHPSRIHIVDSLRDGEHSVSELCEILESEGSSVSQQLSILRANNIVKTRKVANLVYYSIQDQTIFKLLDVAKKIFNNHLSKLQSQVQE